MKPSSDPGPATSPSRARVGVIGPTFVGKTTYFSVLDRALRDQEWRVVSQSDDPESANLLNLIRSSTNQGMFPRKTPVRVQEEKTHELYFRVSKDEQAFEMTFYDPPGEIFEPGAASHHEQTRQGIFRSLEDAAGILVLLNLDKTPHELMNIWHYSIESFIAHVRRAGRHSMLDRDKLGIRVGVVFTKADLLPWMCRHRSRNAKGWLERHEGLNALAKDIGRDCREVKFFFSSAVGWNKGRPNIRSIIRPRGGTDRATTRAATATQMRDLIPDPAEGADRAESDRSLRVMTMPLFNDPLRIVDEVPPEESLVGVITLPGRSAPTIETGRFLTPWNVVEPLLWAAGLLNL